MQPLVLSPKVWMCMPRLALGSWPVMSQLMVVGDDSESCSKTTVPLMLESPRTTATVCVRRVSDFLDTFTDATERKVVRPARPGFPSPPIHARCTPNGLPAGTDTGTGTLLAAYIGRQACEAIKVIQRRHKCAQCSARGLTSAPNPQPRTNVHTAPRSSGVIRVLRRGFLHTCFNHFDGLCDEIAGIDV